MTAERSYRTAIPPELARQELRRCSGAQFDPAVVDAFLNVIESDIDDREPDAAHDAAAYVQTLLGAGAGA
jgi:HD-GYP domain-containing protein (c-di-GMP phosphodiesterase class II)